MRVCVLSEGNLPDNDIAIPEYRDNESMIMTNS